MTNNYRLVQWNEGYVTIHEVYYNDGGDACLYNEHPEPYLQPFKVKEAFSRSVIQEDDLPDELDDQKIELCEV